MRLVVGVLLALLSSAALADPPASDEGEELKGPDGRPSQIMRDRSGVLRTKGGGWIVLFACSPANTLKWFEVEATQIGAPACANGLVATWWTCFPDDLVGEGPGAMMHKEPGRPHCEKGFTAIRNFVPAPKDGLEFPPPPTGK